MADEQTLSIKIELLAQEFRQGISDIKTTVTSLAKDLTTAFAPIAASINSLKDTIQSLSTTFVQSTGQMTTAAANDASKFKAYMDQKIAAIKKYRDEQLLANEAAKATAAAQGGGTLSKTEYDTFTKKSADINEAAVQQILAAEAELAAGYERSAGFINLQLASVARSEELLSIQAELTAAQVVGSASDIISAKSRLAQAELAYQEAVAKAKVASPESAEGQAALVAIEKQYADQRIQIQANAAAEKIALATTAKNDLLAVLRAEAVQEYEIAVALGNSTLAATQAANASRLKAQIDFNTQLASINKSVDTGAMSAEAGEAQRAKLVAQYANEIYRIEVDLGNKRAKSAERTAIQQITAEQRIARAKKDHLALIDLEAQKLIRLEKTKVDAAEAALNALTEETANTNQGRAALEAYTNAKENHLAVSKEILANAEDQKKIRAATDYASMAQSLGQVGMAMAQVGAAAGAMATAALKPVMELEKGLAAVAAVSGKRMDSPGMRILKEQAIDLSNQFLYTTGEIAEGMKFLAQAGFDVPQIKTMTKDILELATAADMPLKDAFNVAATTLRGFKMEAAEMTRVANVLTITANQTNVEVGELAESFKYAGPVAAAAGVSIEDVAASLGLMANAGIKGSMAGTALRQTISSLIAPTSNQRTIIRELGLTVNTTAGNFQGFRSIVEQMQILFKTSITDPAQQAGIAMKLFGDRAGPGMLAVINEGIAGLDKLRAAYSGITEGATAAETAASRMNNLADSMTKFQNAAAGLSGAVFFDLLKVLSSVVNMGTKALKVLTDFAQNNKGITTLVVGILALAAGLGVLVGILGTVIIAVSRFKSELSQAKLQGVSMSALLSLGFRSVAVEGAKSASVIAMFRGQLEGAALAAAKMKLAMMVSGVLTWITVFVALLPFIIEGLKKIGYYTELQKRDESEIKAAVEATNDAYKSLNETIKSTAGQQELVAKYGEDFKAVLESMPEIAKDIAGKDIAPTWEAMVGHINTIGVGMNNVVTKAKALAANNSLNDASYAKQALALLEQAEAWKTIVAQSEKVIEAKKNEIGATLQGVDAERRLLHERISKYEGLGIISDWLLKGDKERLYVLDAQNASLFAQYHALNKGLQVTRQFQDDQVKNILTTRTVAENMGMSLEHSIKTIERLTSEYKRWKDEELAALSFANKSAAVNHIWLTKEEKARAAINREIRTYTTLGYQLEERLIELTNQATAFSSAASSKLNIKSNLELIASYKIEQAAITELAKTAEGAGDKEAADLQRQIQLRKELQAAIKAAAEERLEIGKKLLDTLTKAEEDYFNRIKQLQEDQFTAEKKNLDNAAKVRKAYLRETASSIIEDIQDNFGVLKQKIELAVDQDAKEKALDEIADFVQQSRETLAGTMGGIFRTLTVEERESIAKLGGYAGEYMNKILASAKAANKEHYDPKSRVQAFIEVATQLGVMTEEQEKYNKMLREQRELEQRTVTEGLTNIQTLMRTAKAELGQFKTQFIETMDSLDAPTDRFIKKLANFEPVKTAWAETEKLISDGVTTLSGKRIQINVDVNGMEGLKEAQDTAGKDLKIVPKVEPSKDPATRATMDFLANEDQIKRLTVTLNIPDDPATQAVVDALSGKVQDSVSLRVNAIALPSAKKTEKVGEKVAEDINKGIANKIRIVTKADGTKMFTNISEAALEVGGVSATNVKKGFEYRWNEDTKQYEKSAFYTNIENAAFGVGEISATNFVKGYDVKWNAETKAWEETPFFASLAAVASDTGGAVAQSFQDGITLNAPGSAVAAALLPPEAINQTGDDANKGGKKVGDEYNKGLKSTSAEREQLIKESLDTAFTKTDPGGKGKSFVAQVMVEIFRGFNDPTYWTSLFKGWRDAIDSAADYAKETLGKVLSKLGVNVSVSPDSQATPGSSEPEPHRIGGPIGGYGGGDIVPAMLEPGEFVMRKESVARFGAAFFASLNNMAHPKMDPGLSGMTKSSRVKFADGGLVYAPAVMGTYNLNLSVGGRVFQVQGTRSTIEGLMDQLRREELTTR